MSTYRDPVAIGYESAFARDAQRLPDGTMYEAEQNGIDTYTYLLGCALTGALLSGTTPVIAVTIADEAARAALEKIAARRGEAR